MRTFADRLTRTRANVPAEVRLLFVVPMKVALVLLPRSGNDDGEARVNPGPKTAPRAVMLRRGRISALMLAMTASLASIAVGGYSYLQSGGARAPHSSVAEPKAAELVERAAMVRPVHNPESLKQGDVVVVRPNAFSTPTVQQVAAKPNETVLIRRGGAVDSLYMLGDRSGIVVVSEQGSSRIVTPDQITGAFVTPTNR